MMVVVVGGPFLIIYLQLTRTDCDVRFSSAAPAAPAPSRTPPAPPAGTMPCVAIPPLVVVVRRALRRRHALLDRLLVVPVGAAVRRPSARGGAAAGPFRRAAQHDAPFVVKLPLERVGQDLQRLPNVLCARRISAIGNRSGRGRGSSGGGGWQRALNRASASARASGGASACLSGCHSSARACGNGAPGCDSHRLRGRGRRAASDQSSAGARQRAREEAHPVRRLDLPRRRHLPAPLRQKTHSPKGWKLSTFSLRGPALGHAAHSTQRAARSTQHAADKQNVPAARNSPAAWPSSARTPPCRRASG